MVNQIEIQVVALYAFDPSQIDWPFKKQKPLALNVGQTINVLHDDGSEWALGSLVSDPKQKGYFPKNYTVTLTEYYELMKEYEDKEDEDGDTLPAPEIGGPAKRQPQPPSDLDSSSMNSSELDERSTIGGSVYSEPQLIDNAWKDHPPLSADPPIQTTFSAVKSKLLQQMPSIPDGQEGDTTFDDELQRAIDEADEVAQRITRKSGGIMSDSRCSTPATHAQTRPDREFARKHLHMEQQENVLSELSPLIEVINTRIIPEGRLQETPYRADLRVRATTCRMAASIEPIHMRLALTKARSVGARWTQMFRPELNDIVNESLKMGCDASILSNLYLYDYTARMHFQRLNAHDSNGTLTHALQRQKKHMFYMRMDIVDVMMFHPDAWGFPDAMQVIQNGGDQFDPFHGWLQQSALDADREMEDVPFTYHVRMRSLPERTFQAIALGKIPEWIAPFSELKAELKSAELPKLDYSDSDEDSDDSMSGIVPCKKGEEPAWAKDIKLDENDMLDAGLADEEDVYVKVDSIQMVKERTVAPDVLDATFWPSLGPTEPAFKIKGVNAIRLLLRTRGNPDGTKNVTISPKQVKDMAQQIGIGSTYHYYWYAMFALRWPLPQEYDVIIRNDTRWYLNLITDTLQPIHPFISMFREHLSDCMYNDFLWDYRGFVKMKCSECGIPDSVVWCQQCTDYFCMGCFLKVHKSKRGKKHWPAPIPGTRYLTKAEVRQIADHIPFLNVGFCQRRRFLARDNQSDKTGTCQCKWLYFHRDTFKQALAQAPEKHWDLKRLNPPRLGAEVEGYYYNFESDMIADDPGSLVQKTREQRALLLLQKWVRGAIIRRKIVRWTEAALVIQKYNRMWDEKRYYGAFGSNARIVKGWYRRFQAQRLRKQLHLTASKIQAVFRGKNCRIWMSDCHCAATRIQAMFRGWKCRKQLDLFQWGANIIQRGYRMHIYGKKPVREMHKNQARIAALLRGVLVRSQRKAFAAKITKVNVHARGYLCRLHMKKKYKSATTIQTTWRRFQVSLETKIDLYCRLTQLYKDRQVLMKEKLADLAALLIQRNFRRYRDHQYFVGLRREKTNADKRTSTVLVAIFMAATNSQKFVHPWVRHLPAEIQEVLEQIKASLQRTIALNPITGKLANEEFGKKSKRTSVKDLVLEETENPDLASQILLNIVHHLLSHVPRELYAETIKWASYALAHQTVALKDKVVFPPEPVQLGVEVNPRPGDPLVTLWRDKCHINHHHDRVMNVEDENMYMLILAHTPQHLRHVFLTAQTLITARQALDLPSLSTDDHLAFQGVDATVGAQLQDVLSNEIGHRFPSEWPRNYGTVFALAQQTAKYLTGIYEAGAIPKRMPVPDSADVDHDNGFDDHSTTKNKGILNMYNRVALLRVVQQLSYFMRDQNKLIQVLGNKSQEKSEDPELLAIKTSRFVSVVDKLFDIAYKAKHDHCPFVLSVVLFHMVQRSLMLRILYHRAAQSIQVHFRYYLAKGRRELLLGPTMRIQRIWRGVRSALHVVKLHDAAERIQHNVRATRWKRRNKELVKAVLVIQTGFRGALQRMWIRRCHKMATVIQKFIRAFLVRAVFDKEGKKMASKYKVEMKMALAECKTEQELTAVRDEQLQRIAVGMHRHRERNVDLKRMAGMQGKSRHTRMQNKANRDQAKGSRQPARDTVFEPMTAAYNRLRAMPARYNVGKTKIMASVEHARRGLNKDIPQLSVSMNKSILTRRGRQILLIKRQLKRSEITETEDTIMDLDDLSRWETRQFKTSIPWMPKTIGLRITNKWQTHNLRSTYFLSGAFIGAYLARNDDFVPPWYNRIRMLPPSALADPVQEHMAEACRIIYQKVSQEANMVQEHITPWQMSLLVAKHIWRAIFATCGEKMAKPKIALPVLWMSACESISSSLKSLLSYLWNETEKQFTTKENRYRGIKSRPPWDVIQNLQYKILKEEGGFNLLPPNGEKGTSKAASLDSFFEEVMALRFGIEWMAECMNDGEQYLKSFLKKRARAALLRTKQDADIDLKVLENEDSHAHVKSMIQGVWTDDREIRCIMGFVERLMGSIEGSETQLQATTVACNLLIGVWKGSVSLFQDGAKRAIRQVETTHAVAGRLPVPAPRGQLDAPETHQFDILAYSYTTNDLRDAKTLLEAAPNAILMLVLKVQSAFRSYLLRKKYLERMTTILNYCKSMEWPTDGNAEDAAENKKKLKGKAFKDGNKISENYKPKVSKHLGGPAVDHKDNEKENYEPAPENRPDSPGRKLGVGDLPMEPELRITADHRACADFFAVFLFNMYRRKELSRMYDVISNSYDECVDQFGELLINNPSLKPMVDSVGAHLKRGSVVGFDKAFKGGAQSSQPKQQNTQMRPPDSELFRRQHATTAVTKKSKAEEKREAAEAAERERIRSEEQKDNTVAGDYLVKYLQEMEGDDSQFKDIDASVIPLSTGVSARRIRPDEFLLNDDSTQPGGVIERPQSGASSTYQAIQTNSTLMRDEGYHDDDDDDMLTPKSKEKIDVPWCLNKLVPLWLPIKAHRFTAYRAKILQILPQKVLAQYVEHEKQGHYAACIKLLESALPGSLNVFVPQTLVANKPLLIETVYQLLVGYVGLCLKNQQLGAASRLCVEMVATMGVALKDLHPAHRTVVEACLYDTALSVTYFNPGDVSLARKSETFYQQASQRYLKLNHINRYSKCCLRFGAVLAIQKHHHQAEYFIQQALNKLADTQICSLLVVCYHNLAVQCMQQHRLPDGMAHLRTMLSILKQLPKLSNTWMQKMDNTQWLMLKIQEQYPKFQALVHERENMHARANPANYGLDK